MKNLLVMGIIFLLIGSLGFGSCVEMIDFSDEESVILNEDIEIFGNGISLEKNVPNKILFKGDVESCFVKIGNNEFSNIKPSENGFMNFNEFGEITETRFEVKELEDAGLTKYVLWETTFEVPSGEVYYNEKEGILELPKGSRIISVESSIKISGENLKFWKEGEEYEVSGNLNFDDEGDAFIKEGVVEINNIEIQGSKEGETRVFFNDVSFEENSISFGKDELIIGNQDIGGPIITFKKGNPYLPVEEGDYVAIKGEKGSEIHIKNVDGVSELICEGDFILDNGKNSISSFEGEVYSLTANKLSEDKEGFGSSPLKISIEERFFDLEMNNDSEIFVNKLLKSVEITQDMRDSLKLTRKTYKTKKEYEKALEEYNSRLISFNGEHERYLVDVKNYYKDVENYEMDVEEYEKLTSNYRYAFEKEDLIYEEYVSVKEDFYEAEEKWGENDKRTLEAYDKWTEMFEEYNDYGYNLYKTSTTHLDFSEQEVNFEEVQDEITNLEYILAEYGKLPEKLILKNEADIGAIYIFEFAEPIEPLEFSFEEPILEIDKPYWDPYDGWYYHPRPHAASDDFETMGSFTRGPEGSYDKNAKLFLTKEEFMGLPEELREKYVPGAEAWKNILLRKYSRVKYQY